MAKLTYIDIVGKEYPMSFSLMASKKIAEKYGSIENVMSTFDSKNGITAEALESIIFMIELLISQGCAFKNYFEKDVPPPENAPIVNGKWTPLPREALEVAISIADIDKISEKLTECINGSKDREVAEEAIKKTDAAQE